MNDEWKPTKQKKKEKKKNLNENIREEIFFLSNLLCEGACLRCMNKSCKINHDHGIPYPEKIGVFVQNPSYISGMDKVFNDADIDFNGKKPFYTICNYINGNCRNCQEGRIKYIKYNDESIALCYPILENIRNKVTIGVHADIKLVMKGNKFDSSIIPVEIVFEEDNFDSDKYNNEEVVDEWPILNEYKKNNFQDENESKKNFENSFLNALKLNSNDDKIKHYEDKIIDEYDNKYNDTYNDAYNDTYNDAYNDTYNDKENINFKNNNYDYRYENDYQFRLEEQNHFLEEEVLRLTKMTDSLHEKNFLLDKKIHSLEEKIEYDKVIFKYGEKYDEILYNLNNLNNRISDQFFEKNYSDYIIL
jgi:hypothetical protein